MNQCSFSNSDDAEQALCARIQPIIRKHVPETAPMNTHEVNLRSVVELSLQEIFQTQDEDLQDKIRISVLRDTLVQRI